MPTREPAAPPSLVEEDALWARGFARIAGLDEVGRGAWAGPLVAGAVVLPVWNTVPGDLDGVRDSKELTPLARERYEAVIRRRAVAVGIGLVGPAEIDLIGLAEAGWLAMRRAIRALDLAPDFLMIDAFSLPGAEVPHLPLLHGDQRSLTIAAASIVAKVYRDRVMRELAAAEPCYGFAAHKGYGTVEHRAALDRHGPCVYHRWSYEPVRLALRCGDEPRR